MRKLFKIVAITLLVCCVATGFGFGSATIGGNSEPLCYISNATDDYTLIEDGNIVYTADADNESEASTNTEEDSQQDEKKSPIEYVIGILFFAAAIWIFVRARRR